MINIQSEDSPNLSDVSDGELMELLVPSQTSSRRMLVMWLYLRTHRRRSLEEFDQILTSLAEKELQRRAGN